MGTGHRKIIFTLKRELTELLEEVLFRYEIGGIEVVDGKDVNDYLEDHPAWEITDLERQPEETVDLVVYLSEESVREGEMQSLLDAVESFSCAQASSVEIDVGPVVREEDWAESWKKQHRSRRIGESFRVAPPWERDRVQEGERLIVIDPGMAFGTGDHETSAMCLEQMEKTDMQGSTVVDIGCGSGILSIAAVQLGAGRVVAVDIDPVAAEATKSNSVENGMANRIEVRVGDLFEEIDFFSDVILANLLAEILVKLIDESPKYLRPGGRLIASGILSEKAESVLDALTRQGYETEEVVTRGEWVCIRARYERG